MKEVTKLMIRDFKLKELGYDFMGYHLNKDDIFTVHHLIIPARDGGEIIRPNISILCGKTSHPYLHLIEAKDEEIFYHITSEMIDMNIKGRLDVENLREIDDLLTYFEREHCSDRGKKGKMLIKEEYLRRGKF
jgi:hypothetical protein